MKKRESEAVNSLKRAVLKFSKCQRQAPWKTPEWTIKIA